MSYPPPRPAIRKRSDGERSRQAILDTAPALATVEGLEGLSIGRLAQQVGISKSGLYAHFGSKQELQLATIDVAERIFTREVLEPAEQHPPGVRRIVALTGAFCSYLERRVFPGGCFFAATGGEFAGRDGPVADRIRDLNRASLENLVTQVRAAQAAGELDPVLDADQLAFEIDSLMLGAHAPFALFDDPAALDHARRAVRDRLHPPHTPAAGDPR